MKNILIISCILLSIVAINYAQVANICFGKSNGSFLPDVTNCSNYYTCYQNVGYMQTCPSGYEYNSFNQMCDYPSATTCVKCPAAASTAELTFIPIPGVCDQYIICAGGNPFMQSCQGGLEYNNSTQQCDFASNVNCATKPAACLSSTNNTLTFVPGGSGCTRYTICYGGVSFGQTCATGTLFNPTQNACVPASTYTCPTSTTSARSIFYPAIAKPSQFELKYRHSVPCPATGTKSFPHARSCSRYLFCVDGQSALLSCAEGLYFDSKTETCRLPEDADCKA